jgi:hypothetical protein
MIISPDFKTATEKLAIISGISITNSEVGNRTTITAETGFRLSLRPRPIEGGIYWQFIDGGEDLGNRPLAGFHLGHLVHSALNGR